MLPYGTYYEPDPNGGYSATGYEAETYSGYGGARYLEQHWPATGPEQGHTVRAQNGPPSRPVTSPPCRTTPPPPTAATPAPAPDRRATTRRPSSSAPARRTRPALPPVPGPRPRRAPGPLYVVGDVHGYLDELRTELRHQGLIDADGHWSAGRSRIWFLGDFTDRGPDGIGVIDLVMQLAAESAAAGGYCRALMGNHELLFLGAARYGDEPVQSTAGTASFLAAWRLNGGQQSDLERLEAHHISWLSRLPAIALEDGHLLLHSDTTAYLEYGESIPEVNDAVHDLLADEGVDEWWDCFRRFTKRFAFRGDSGPTAVRELLDAFGGARVVHGHSPIPYLTGAVHADDGMPPHVPGPYVYAEDLAVAMDGGVTMEGRLLVSRLPI